MAKKGITIGLRYVGQSMIAGVVGNIAGGVTNMIITGDEYTPLALLSDVLGGLVGGALGSGISKIFGTVAQRVASKMSQTMSLSLAKQLARSVPKMTNNQLIKYLSTLYKDVLPKGVDFTINSFKPFIKADPLYFIQFMQSKTNSIIIQNTIQESLPSTLGNEIVDYTIDCFELTNEDIDELFSNLLRLEEGDKFETT